MSSLLYPRDHSTPVSHLPFSPVVQTGSLLFVSGQASVDDNGKIVSGSFEEEFHRSVDNLEKVLGSAGAGLADVIQTRNYVRDPAYLGLYNELYAARFPAPRPARTTITNCLPPSLHYEIECVARKTQSTNLTNPAPTMLVHTVFFWLRPDLTPEELDTFVREGLESLRGIPSLEGYFIGTPADTGDRPVIDRSYQYSITCLFADVSAHDQYQEDPRHLRFVERFKSFWNRVQVYDAD